MEIDIDSDRFGIGPWSPPSGSAGTFMCCWRVRRPEFPKELEPFCQVTVNDSDGIQNSCYKIYYVYIYNVDLRTLVSSILLWIGGVGFNIHESFHQNADQF